MIKVFLVGIGGFIGSVFRYLLGSWVSRLFNNPEFPYGTFTVNILGCLIIGFLGGIVNLILGTECPVFFGVTPLLLIYLLNIF